MSSQADARKLEAENAELRKEIVRLKQQLVMEEIRNGGSTGCGLLSVK